MFLNHLDHRRKKLYFRSCHRGIKEMDIIFTQFAKQFLLHLSSEDLDEYERILEIPDTEIFSWIMKRRIPPTNICSKLLNHILSLKYMDS